MAAADSATRQVVFVQHSVHLAGAQKSLSRLLTAPGMQRYSPVLLTSEEGWLTRFCTEKSVPWVRLPFPSPRSFASRFLCGNAGFARRAAEALRPSLHSGRELIVHANDHPDSLLGLALAKELRAHSVLTLRTPAMSQRDFIKHGGLQQDRVIAVGNELAESASAWLPRGEATLIHNGVTDEEILSPGHVEASHANCVLVLGSMTPRKGWQDLVEALILLEASLPEGPLPQIHFLGDLLGQDPVSALQLSRLKRFQTTFLGVQEKYRDCLRQYPLAVHPSRSESFGMAALECVAAGVPLVAAATGVIPQFIPRPSFLFPPQDPATLAAALSPLLSRPLSLSAADFDLTTTQAEIRTRFSTSSTVQRLTEVYEGRRSAAGC